MSPSKRFEETRITKKQINDNEFLLFCESCKHTFEYIDGDSEDSDRPNFCPKCGRKAAPDA